MLVIIVLGVILAALLLIERSTGEGNGFASGTELRKALGKRQLFKRARVLRPGTKPKTADGLGLRLGKAKLWGSIEDSYLVLGPPRAGKGRGLIIPWVNAYPGPCVVTSTRDDLVRGTAAVRARKGPLWLFDPAGVVKCDEAELCCPGSWDLTSDCENPLTAILRARVMVASSQSHDGVRHGDFWKAASETILRCMLHAAALSGRDVRDVRRWISEQKAMDAVDALADPSAAPGWREDLLGLIELKDESRTSVFASAQMCLNCLADPRVLAAVSADGSFDVDEFVRSNGTLFIVGTSEAQHSMAPVVVALVEAIVQRAKQVALASVGGRLDPPLGLFLDEAANIAPLPSLPRLVSDGGGHGITPVVVLQSLAQARERWGMQASQAIVDACTTKLIFGGLTNHDDLEDLSRVVGNRFDQALRLSQPVLSSADIRGLKPSRVLLLHKGMKPTVISVGLRGGGAHARGRGGEKKRAASRTHIPISPGQRGTDGRSVTTNIRL